MTLRVGRIPFLVCAPFFHDFLGREGDFGDVAFLDGPPSVQCAGLMDGTIHLSPASSIAFAQKPGAFVLSSSLCTSCSFEVRSVKLFAQRPIEELNGCRVRLTSQSKTSVTLLRILLEMRLGLHPEYVTGIAAEADDEACLLIGDLALEENERHRFAYSYDLGALWQDWHGLPFVFGAWIIAKEALSPTLRPVLESYMQRTEQGIETFKKAPSQALDRWLAKYPVNLPRTVVEDYYRVLDYRFTDERKKSLSLFYELAAKMGIIASKPAIEYF
ncbi:MAG: menaquinone biosynthesis protein [Fibrobacter sp.]|nr:menaquinone biosynthesis protein [Fibrobacter sp.]